MIIVGWCRVCRKIRPVRVIGPWRVPLAEGVCRDCEDAQRES